MSRLQWCYRRTAQDAAWRRVGIVESITGDAATAAAKLRSDAILAVQAVLLAAVWIVRSCCFIAPCRED
ncbi:MAG: hypothetical protein R3B46_06340 [Phycisphaerales bacterium]